jgi:phosphopantothenoylcysteine decarboxylase/phosphopantothenate--cysteine ligase
MTGQRILLIIGGGIAAYKSLELIRLLAREGVATRCILTRAGAEFVTPLSVAALSGDKVHQDLFDLNDETEMGHIQLSRWADLIVVCPATADFLAKAAAGLAGDLATTTLLARDKPVLMAPAMNVRMWAHPAVQRNVALLRADGVDIMPPDDGEMACGEYGPGRLPAPEAILQRILERLAEARSDKTLAGRRIVVTAGPTREAIDPVRFLSNRSSGRQGYAIAGALAQRGAETTLISGPTALSPPAGVAVVQVETALAMLAAVESAMPADAFISVAAVADWRPAAIADRKLKLKGARSQPLRLDLVENPDILRTIAQRRRQRPRLVVGFAAETDGIAVHAPEKLRRKGCDWIIANDVSGDVMGGAENQVTLYSQTGAEEWPRMSKERVAGRIADAIAAALAAPPGSGDAKRKRR